MIQRLIACALLLLPLATASGQFTAREYQQRREALAARVQDGVILVLGSPEPEADYVSFYQNASFNYLTGILEPNAALVMVKRGGSVASTLFVQPRNPATEVWSGSRIGVDGARQRTGVDARPSDQLLPTLDSLAGAGLHFHVVGQVRREPEPEREARVSVLSPDEQLVRRLRAKHPDLQVESANAVVAELRGKKSPGEQALIRKAVDITVLAHREAMQALEPGMNEFEIQALIEYTFRRNGAERPSFATIVGSGPNSTTLHYNANDRFIERGETVVMDIGASYKGYAADVTRTIPANGTFSPAQRDVYQVVRDAQAAAERAAKLGAPSRAMSDSATAVIAAGLARLGLIESPTATYDCGAGQRIGKCPQVRLFYMHGLGHGIGLEVHDPDQYYYTQKIEPGSAFTIEPGLYVRPDVLDVLPDTPANRAMAAKLRGAVEKYRNTGVRIEDDYLVTEKGVEWISRAPREIPEIEALMRGPYNGPAPRNKPLVESYRAVVP